MTAAAPRALDARSLRDLVGQEVAVSNWLAMPQSRIATFADATEDHQWIHLDVERCRTQSPFGGTVAHGFLTLSLIPALFADAIELTGAKMVLNYGLNKVRFPAPVQAGSRVRARMQLAAIEAVDGGTQLTWHVVIEADGGARPVCVAEMLMRVYLDT